MSSGIPTAYPKATSRNASTMIPPPVGYPTTNVTSPNPQSASYETKSRGDGFWKGCCAALCCCCVLDACF
ncbi:protein CYSTEINE-RICH TRANSMEMBRANE MODULE 9-like [Prosopis cineraria]|uniref:protein CYSTEINE-RICH TRANSMEMBRANE MODULE 9-like n=1 Tax=Prosopis cineraria TaxID=364024 RepID=UPI00240F6409|nr:protein CYSTEINE-RICH TRANSMEMBRANE MODULE 9-like [Prosopis cineraria]